MCKKYIGEVEAGADMCMCRQQSSFSSQQDGFPQLRTTKLSKKSGRKLKLKLKHMKGVQSMVGLERLC